MKTKESVSLLIDRIEILLVSKDRLLKFIQRIKVNDNDFFYSNVKLVCLWEVL